MTLGAGPMSLGERGRDRLMARLASRAPAVGLVSCAMAVLTIGVLGRLRRLRGVAGLALLGAIGLEAVGLVAPTASLFTGVEAVLREHVLVAPLARGHVRAVGGGARVGTVTSRALLGGPTAVGEVHVLVAVLANPGTDRPGRVRRVTILAILMSGRSLERDVVLVARRAVLRLALVELVRLVTVRARVVALEQGLLELRGGIFRMAGNTPARRFSRRLVGLVTVSTDELLLAISPSVLDVLLALVTARALSLDHPRLLVGLMAVRTRLCPMDIDLGGALLAVPVALLALPRALPDRFRLTEVMTS